MKKYTEPTAAALLLAALLGLFGLAAYGSPVNSGEVTIVGRLHADSADLADAVLVVEVEQEHCLRSVLLRNGRFNFEVPVGARARLLFVKPGFHTKEVVVDTQHALCSDRARKLNDKVKFDVVLEPLAEHPNETYAGPVGSIHFVKGTGLIRVKHDGRMVGAMDDRANDR